VVRRGLTRRLGRARTAARGTAVIRAFYERLLAMGKAKKVALVACLQKLLTCLNAMLEQFSLPCAQPAPRSPA